MYMIMFFKSFKGLIYIYIYIGVFVAFFFNEINNNMCKRYVPDNTSTLNVFS